MAKNMTFQVSLKLLTKNFQNGIKSIQNSLRGLRSQFQTFVGGIGLGLGVRELIENAKSLDKARATLKNVSVDAEVYGENLKFVDMLSKKYNQDLIVLMGNFSKFHSAASYAGMSLEEQQHIYESLTRAAAYFNLTADETNGVMLAVQQMISKGKVSTEELRRQLGERLPGAMNLAAKAMGMTTAELDKQIRLGRVAAKDMLPKLADELFKLTGNFNVDNIQGSIGLLKNSFTNLVDELGVGDIYKKFLKGLAGGLDYIRKNLKDVARAIQTALLALASAKLFKMATNYWNGFFGNINKQLTESTTKLKIYKKELETLSTHKGVTYNVNAKTGRIGVNPKDNTAVNPDDLIAAQSAERGYNAELKKSNTLQAQLNNKWKTMGAHILRNLGHMIKMAAVQMVYMGIFTILSSIVTQIVSWYKEQQRIKNIVKDTRKEYEQMANQLGVDDTELMTLKEMLKTVDTEKEREQVIKRINKLLGLQGNAAFTVLSADKDINKAIEDRLKLLEEERRFQAAKAKAGEYRSKIKELEIERDALKAENATIPSGKKKLFAGMSGPMATTKSSPEDASVNTKRLNNARIEDINKEIAQLTEALNFLEGEIKKYVPMATERETLLNGDSTYTEEDDLKTAYDKIQKEYNNALRALKDKLKDGVIKQDEYNKELKNLTLSTLDSIYALDDIDENTDKFAKGLRDAARKYLSREVFEEYEKIQKEYNLELKALKDKLNDGIITQGEYDEAVAKLCESTLDSIYALDDIDESSSLFVQTLKNTLEKYKESTDTLGKTLDALKEYQDGVQKLKRQYADGLISQKELEDGLYDLLEEVVLTMSALGTLSASASDLAEEFKRQKSERAMKDISDEDMPKLGKFDGTTAYKKSNSELYEEVSSFLEGYAKELETYTTNLEKYKGTLTGDDLTQLMSNIDLLGLHFENLTNQAETFAEAAKYAEVQEDIKNLKTELAAGVFDNISNIATAAERLTNSWKSLKETMNDPETSGWEKFLTLFTTIISTIETLVGVIEAFQTVMKIAEAISLATMAAEQAGIPIKVQDSIATQVQAAATKELAVARHMAAAATLPYPANIAAIANTAGALAAAFAAIPAFAEGGIVKGASSVGDRNLIRVNAGEAVLTKGQQATLWHLLNGQSAGFNGARGNVEFKIRGADLVGTINNYTSRKRG